MNRTQYHAFIAYGLAAQRAEQMGLTHHQFELLAGKGRGEPHKSRRRELMRWLRGLGYSYPVIGAVFGRDHATAIHALAVTTDCEVGALQ